MWTYIFPLLQLNVTSERLLIKSNFLHFWRFLFLPTLVRCCICSFSIHNYIRRLRLCLCMRSRACVCAVCPVKKHKILFLLDTFKAIDGVYAQRLLAFFSSVSACLFLFSIFLFLIFLFYFPYGMSDKIRFTCIQRPFTE